MADWYELGRTGSGRYSAALYHELGEIMNFTDLAAAFHPPEWSHTSSAAGL